MCRNTSTLDYRTSALLIGFIVVCHQLFISSSNQHRLDEAGSELARLIGTSEIVVLGPTYGAADDFVRAVAERQGSLHGVHRLTLVQLAATLSTAKNTVD